MTTLHAAFVLLLGAPIVEEVIFRSGLQDWLQNRWPDAAGARRSHLCTTAAFCLAHAATRGWALGGAVLLPAWVIGSVYRHRRQVAPCVVLHAAFNLGWLIAAPHLTRMAASA